MNEWVSDLVSEWVSEWKSRGIVCATDKDDDDGDSDGDDIIIYYDSWRRNRWPTRVRVHNTL